MASSASTSNVNDGLHIVTTPSGVTSAAASIHDRISGQAVSPPAFERTALLDHTVSGTPQYNGSDNGQLMRFLWRGQMTDCVKRAGSAKLITSKNTRSTNYAKLKYYIPALAWIPNYSVSLCVLVRIAQPCLANH